MSDFKKQVDVNHYNFLKYVDKNRFMSFYYQLRYIYSINPSNVLEVGHGSGFIKKILQSEFDFKTLDIESGLNPDIVGSVLEMPIKDKSFDLVCCFQVLEHIPFYNFERALLEMYRVSKKNVIISLPFSGFRLGFEVRINKKKKIFYFY